MTGPPRSSSTCHRHLTPEGSRFHIPDSKRREECSLRGIWNLEFLRDRDGDETEAEQENAEASEREEGSAVIERLVVVFDGRMPDSDEERRDQSEDRPRQAAEGARGGEPDDDQRDQG